MPSAAHRPRIAFATSQAVVDSSKSSWASACGLVKWCYSMSFLTSLPFLAGTADALLLTNAAASLMSGGLCHTTLPNLRIIAFDPDLVSLVKGWRQVLNYSAVSRKVNKPEQLTWNRQISLHALFKWQLFQQSEYSAILFTDADVDLFLPSAGRPPRPDSRSGRALHQALTAGVAAFLRSDAQLVASPDEHSPINTGVMLLKVRPRKLSRSAHVSPIVLNSCCVIDARPVAIAAHLQHGAEHPPQATL